MHDPGRVRRREAAGDLLHVVYASATGSPLDVIILSSDLPGTNSITM
jgi:hypothetical protein